MELVRCREKLHDVDFYKARMEAGARPRVGSRRTGPGGGPADSLSWWFGVRGQQARQLAPGPCPSPACPSPGASALLLLHLEAPDGCEEGWDL